MNKEQALVVALEYFKGYPTKNEVVITTDGQAFHSDNGGAARIHQERLGGQSFRITRKETEAMEKSTFDAASQELLDHLKVLAANGLNGKILAKIHVAGSVEHAKLSVKEMDTYVEVLQKIKAAKLSQTTTNGEGSGDGEGTGTTETTTGEGSGDVEAAGKTEATTGEGSGDGEVTEKTETTTGEGSGDGEGTGTTETN